MNNVSPTTSIVREYSNSNKTGPGTWVKEADPYDPDELVKKALESASEGHFALLEDMLIGGIEYEETERLCQAEELYAQKYRYAPILAQLAAEKLLHLKTHPNLANGSNLGEIRELCEMAETWYGTTGNNMPHNYRAVMHRQKEAMLCWQFYTKYKEKIKAREPVLLSEHLNVADQIFSNLNLVAQAAAIYKAVLVSQKGKLNRGRIVKCCFYLMANKEYATADQIFEKMLSSNATPAEIGQVKLPILYELKKWQTITNLCSVAKFKKRTVKDLTVEAHALLMEGKYDQACGFYGVVRNCYQDKMDIPPNVIVESASAIIGSSNAIEKLRKELDEWNRMMDERDEQSEDADVSECESELRGSGPICLKNFSEEDVIPSSSEDSLASESDCDLRGSGPISEEEVILSSSEDSLGSESDGEHKGSGPLRIKGFYKELTLTSSEDSEGGESHD